MLINKHKLSRQVKKRESLTHKPSNPHCRIGAYPSFRSMKQLGVLLLLLVGMLVHRRLPLSISSGFPDSLPVPIYTPGLIDMVTYKSFQL